MFKQFPVLMISCAHIKLPVDYKLCCHSRTNVDYFFRLGARYMSLRQHGALILSQLKSERNLSGENIVEDVHCFLDMLAR
jgi:hypothetical protein